MTTVFFTESSKNIGGQELQLLQQAVGLMRQGVSVKLLCRPQSRIAQEAAKLGLNIEAVPFRNALDPKSLMRVGQLLKAHQPVAVICHSGHDSNLTAIATRVLHALGVLPSRPRLIRMRTYQPGPAKAFTYNQLFDQTLTPSQALKDQLLGNPHILPAKIGVLYPGIDFQAIEQAALHPLPTALQTQLDANPGGPVLAHAAMLRGEKGHAFMLEVVAKLVDRYPKLLYVIAGEGPEQQALVERAKQLGLTQHVVLTGTLTPVAPLLKRADVVVMPSHYEPLGMSQIESLGLGTPVVVSRVGGLPETVVDGETGVVCPPPYVRGAEQAWADALDRLLSNPEHARAMAAAGQARVRAQFGLQSNLGALLDLFNQPMLGHDQSAH